MIVFDRDGTLYNYDYAWYRDREHPWTDPETHVFLQDQIFTGMRDFLNQLKKNNEEICILSKMPENLPEATLNSMALDKLTHFASDGVDIWKGNIYFTKLDKAAYFRKLTGRLPDKGDFLFSDYQPELESWKLIGGTAVKVLNGVNSLDHWADKYIDARENGNTIMKAFLKIRTGLSE